MSATQVHYRCGNGVFREGGPCLAMCSREEDADELVETLNNHAALVEALEPFAQIGDIVNDPDFTIWTRKVSAESVRRARAALEQLRKAGEGK